MKEVVKEDPVIDMRVRLRSIIERTCMACKMPIPVLSEYFFFADYRTVPPTVSRKHIYCGEDKQ